MNDSTHRESFIMNPFIPRTRRRATPMSRHATRGTTARARVRPSTIWFTHGRIHDRFSGCAKTLAETLDDIVRGRITVDDLPPISVVTHDVDAVESDGSASEDRGRRGRGRGERRGGRAKTERRLYSMNNRRLWVMREAERLGVCEDVGVRMLSREQCEVLLRKGSRNFRVDRCTPGPVKIVPTREEPPERRAEGENDA